MWQCLPPTVKGNKSLSLYLESEANNDSMALPAAGLYANSHRGCAELHFCALYKAHIPIRTVFAFTQG